MYRDSTAKVSAERWRLKFRRPDPALLVIIAVSIAFSALFSYLSVQKYLAMHSTGFDLGIYAQVLYSTLHGQPFQTNLLPINLLSEHFSPFLFVLLLPYAVYSSPVTLLVTQGFVIGMSAVPLYLIARDWIIMVRKGSDTTLTERNMVPALLSLTFLLSPLIESPVGFDFHLMTFLPLFFFWQFYFFLKRKWIYSAIFLALIVSLHSSFVFIVIFTITGEFFIYRSPKYFRREERIRIFSRRAVKYLAIFIGINAALGLYYYAIGYFKPVFSGLPPSTAGPRSGQTGAPSHTTLGLIRVFLHNPHYVITYSMLDSHLKFIFLKLIFGSTGYISIIFPEMLISAVPYMLYGMLSTYTAYYSLGYQYSMMVMPMLFVATAGAIARILGSRAGSFQLPVPKAKIGAATAIAILLALSIGANFTATPIAPPSHFHRMGTTQDLWTESPGNASALALNISRNIPANSYVLTQNNVFPFFADNVNAFSTPWTPGYSVNQTGSFDYMVIEFNGLWANAGAPHRPSMYTMINAALKGGNFGIYAEGYRMLVLEQNYTGQPKVYSPSNFNLTSSSIKHSASIDNYMGRHFFGNSSKVYFTTPGKLFMPGTYRITVSYSVNASEGNGAFNLSLAERYAPNLIGTLHVSPSASSIVGNGTHSETFTFSPKIPLENVMFIGSSSGYQPAVQSILVKQISA